MIIKGFRDRYLRSVLPGPPFAFALLCFVCGCSDRYTGPDTARWTAEEAWLWWESTGWVSGCNFQPSTAVNQLEMWQEKTFDPQTMDRELGWAEGLGFNIMRVYLHSYAWQQDPGGFKDRIDQYLSIADNHGIRTMFVFFDDCWIPVARPGPQPEPLAGIHNSGWVQDPSCDLRQDTAVLFAWLETYVKDILAAFGKDRRVLAWDLYNEPGNSDHGNGSLPLLRNVFRWAREAGPEQPLTSGIWRLALDSLNLFQAQHSDIISYHNYLDPEIHRTWLKLLKTHGRPMICTEYMARQFNSKFTNVLPMLRQENVGAVNWGLVSGKTNTIFMWDTPMPEGGEPDIWFTDIFRKDGTPFSEAEIAFIKQMNGIPMDNE
jgi:hypothetical protein